MDEVKKRLLSELKASGKSIASFSRERGIPVHRLYGMTKGANKSQSTEGFVRVDRGALLSVLISERVRIEVPIAMLSEVLSIVGAN